MTDDEIRQLRAALEELNPASEGFGEAFDWLRARGLLVQVPSDEAFRAEWGDVATMYVWRWRAESETEPRE